METNWRPGSVPAPGATYVQVDIEAAELGRSVPAQVAVAADIGRFLDALLPS